MTAFAKAPEVKKPDATYESSYSLSRTLCKSRRRALVVPFFH